MTVIFDFDGVIADTNNLHLTAWDLAYENLTKCRVERLSRFAGLRTETIASILAKESTLTGRTCSAADIRRLKQRILTGGEISCEAVPGIHGFLAQLSAREVRWGIASNSSREFVGKILADLGIDTKVLVGAEDVIRPKPAPDAFWACANRLGVSESARHTVRVFEDSEHGIKAAVAAGMIPFGIATDITPARLVSAGARRVYRDFTEIGSEFFG
jgi:HAD superfamily hydrolase (TIGR01509 family)